MMEQIEVVENISTCSSWKILFVLLLKFELVITSQNLYTSYERSNHSCYTCIEPLVGYTDHPGSCKYLNVSSSSSLSFVAECNITDNYEYECRKVVISYRSVETSLRRDCVPKGLCSWKDKTQSMVNTPISDCVYTDELTEKLECIYCCDTPLCNRTCSYRMKKLFLFIVLLFIYIL